MLDADSMSRRDLAATVSRGYHMIGLRPWIARTLGFAKGPKIVVVIPNNVGINVLPGMLHVW